MRKIDRYLDLYKELEFYHRIYKTTDLEKEALKVREEEASLINRIAKRKDIGLYQAIYHYLAWNGYFSVEGTFIASSLTSTELKSDLGIAIACGNGCCRNFALHFKSIVELLDKNASLILIGTKYSYKQDSLPKNNKIKRKINKENFIEPKIGDWWLPNHIELLDMTDSSEPKILDPFNMNIQQVLDKKESISRRKMIDFGVGIFLDFDMESDLRDTIIADAAKLERNASAKALRQISRDERLFLQQEAIEMCEENKGLLKDYQEKMNGLYQDIKCKTKIYQLNGF